MCIQTQHLDQPLGSLNSEFLDTHNQNKYILFFADFFTLISYLMLFIIKIELELKINTVLNLYNFCGRSNDSINCCPTYHITSAYNTLTSRLIKLKVYYILS